MVYRIHRHAAHMWTNAFPTRPSGLTKRNVFVLDVANLANRRPANQRYAPNFAGRHSQLCVVAFFGNELRKRARRPCHLATFAGTQFDVVNLRAQRNVD